MRRFAHIIISVIALVVSGCTQKGRFDPEYLVDDTPRLIVDGVPVQVFDFLTWQTAVDGSRRSYRMFKDDMSAYYNVDLGEIPGSKNQNIKSCTVKWTDESNLTVKSNITLIVEEIHSDGKVWLWNPTDKIVLILQLL